MKKLSIPLIILGVLLSSVNCYSMSDILKQRVEKELVFLASKEPFAYVWGAADPFGGKADCSGYICGLMKALQIPILRTTSLEMSMGLKGWTHKVITVEDLDSTDVVWFTWSESAAKRPMGHIGLMMISRKSGLLELAHASSTKKKFSVEPLKGKFLKDLSRAGRFTFGEIKEPILGPGIIHITKPGVKK